MSVEFRKATTADLDDSLKMMQDFYKIDNYLFDKDLAAKNFHQFISSNELGIFWLLEFEKEVKEVIGYLILTLGYSFEYGGRDAFVDELYLMEKYRGRGIGTEVLEQLDSKTKALRIRAIHLEVENTNSVGKSLYLKSGFQRNDRSLLTKKINQ